MRGTTATLAQRIGRIPRPYSGALTVRPFDGRTTTMTTSIYLLSNAPLRGTITSVSARDAQASTLYPGTTMPAQWAIQGRFEGDARAKKDQIWSGSGDAMLYVDQDKTTSPLLALGIFEQAGERAGKPFYRVVYGGEVQFMQREENKRKHITLSRVGEPAAPQTGLMATNAQNQVRPAPYTPRPTVAGTLNQQASESAMATAFPPATDEWAALEARLLRSKQIACRIWGADYDPRALVAFTATAFIAADRHNLPGTAVMDAPATVPAAMTMSWTPPHQGQVDEYRRLLNMDDPYAGGNLFSMEERQQWLSRLGDATALTLSKDLDRLKKTVAQRTAAPTGAGPGHPSSFADVPTALERGDAADSDDLPF